jgi:hypothetical protein
MKNPHDRLVERVTPVFGYSLNTKWFQESKTFDPHMDDQLHQRLGSGLL